MREKEQEYMDIKFKGIETWRVFFVSSFRHVVAEMAFD